jgi:putative Flp pilus-assembly TadE/G-like protein
VWGLRARLHDERGQVIVFSALALPTFLVLLALIMDAGNWFTHGRQLRHRADAAAHATAVEYQRQWANCTSANEGRRSFAAAALDTEARRYAGGSVTPPPSYNREVTADPEIQITFGENANACPDPAATPPQRWMNARVTEKKLSSFLGGFGVALDELPATSRLEVLQAASETGFLPLAAESPVTAIAGFHNGCSPDEPTNWVDLNPANPQPIGPISVQLPNAGSSPFGCAKTAGQLDYEPISLEVRVASRPGIDLRALSCTTLQAMPFADCYRSLTEFRTWADVGDDGAGKLGDRPLVFGVSLTPGSCSPDPFYARLADNDASCTFDASVDMHWSDRPAPSVCTAQLRVVDSTSGATVDSAPLTGPCPEEGTWMASGLELDSLGPAHVRIDWTWVGGTALDTWQGKPCPCSQSGSIVLHRTNLADDPNTDTSPSDNIRMARVTDAATGNIVDSVYASGGTIDVNLTVDLRSAVPGQYGLLRNRFGLGMLICDLGLTFQEMISQGCKPPYGANDFATGYWWDGSRCPDQGTWFSPPDANGVYPQSPWRCVPAQAWVLGSAGQIAQGLNDRIQCSPNRYDEYYNPPNPSDPTPPIDPADPRFINVYVVPAGGLRAALIPAPVPIMEMARFYVTDWGRPLIPFIPPCAENENRGLRPGTVGGYFVSAVTSSAGPVANQPCDHRSPTPCRAVLAR